MIYIGYAEAFKEELEKEIKNFLNKKKGTVEEAREYTRISACLKHNFFMIYDTELKKVLHLTDRKITSILCDKNIVQRWNLC